MYRNLELNDLPNEVWKPIKNYEDKYLVSNLGRVKSIITLRKDKRGYTYGVKPRIMKQSFTSTGYLMVNLNGKFFKVHRLVAFAFIDKPVGKDFINHKDFNTTNNRVENLEWVTPRENVLHAVNGHRNNNYHYFDKEIAIQEYKSGISANVIAKKMNIPKHCILNLMHKNNIKRNDFPRNSKYKLTIKELKELLLKGFTNKEIATKYNIPNNYIARRKYQIKKGEI